MTRWRATVHYRSATGLVDVPHELTELSELHNLVEKGPAWWTIERIDIFFVGTQPPEAKDGTVEEARGI